MLFLVELDHIKSRQPLTPEAGRAFIEQIIQPTLAQPEQPRVRAEQVGEDSLEPRSGRFRRGFEVHTHRAETVPSQIQDKGSPGEGDEAEQRTEFRQLGSQHERQDSCP
jgi:hypothetical protein